MNKTGYFKEGEDWCFLQRHENQLWPEANLEQAWNLWKKQQEKPKGEKGWVKGSLQEDLESPQQLLTSGLEGLGKAWGILLVVKGHPGFGKGYVRPHF